MSYAVSLFRAVDGEDPLATYRRLSAGETTPADAPLDRELICSTLRQHVPDLQALPPEADVALNDGAAQLEVRIGAGCVDITLPYARCTVPLSLTRMQECVAALAPCGYTAYDHQLQRVVGAADMEAQLNAMRQVAESLPALLCAVEESQAEAARAAARPVRRPWWKFWA